MEWPEDLLLAEPGQPRRKQEPHQEGHDPDRGEEPPRPMDRRADGGHGERDADDRQHVPSDLVAEGDRVLRIIQEEEFRDPETGESFDRAALNAELEKIETPAGIVNPKDFRNEIVNFVLRARANNGGRNPTWNSYEKLREVIEKKMFSNTEDLLPVISFNAKASADELKKHENFVARMVAKGYTEKQVRLLAEWYLRVRKAS